MPTIDVDYAELERLLKTPLGGDMEKLDDILSFVKGEVKLYNKEEGIVSIEIKDTNRPDLWGVEGLSRALQGYLGKKNGARHYRSADSIVDVNVDGSLNKIRPYICCSIVKNIHLTDPIIRGLMHLQDKLDQTYGRNRQKTSIGLYDFNLISPPLSYATAKPSDVSFIPLGFSEAMTLADILERHPKGLQYGHIVKKHSIYPLLMDSEKKVLSFPPIINSNDLGRVTEETRNLLVEVTGTQHQTVLNTLNLMTTALIDRGGKAYSATVRYPEDTIYPKKKIITPDFHGCSMVLKVEDTCRLLGIKIAGKRIAKLLRVAGFDTEINNEKTIKVHIPCYRTDVMHQVDLIEDVAIAYGYNSIVPLWRDLPTTGGTKSNQRLLNVARELAIGLGYQEISTYTLSNSENLFAKMNSEATPTIEILNPKVVTMTCLRNWLLPSLIEFLGNNQSTEFPQKIFELGKVTFPDETQETRSRDEDWLAAVTCHAAAGFSEIKSALDAFFANLGLDWKIAPGKHPSLLEGRTGTVVVENVAVGIIGELNPLVLEMWKLENPAATFEVNMTKIVALRNAKSQRR